jgi:NADH dehydrogenase
MGIEPVLGDLTNPESLIRACEGMTTVIATANAAIPTRPGDTFEAVERHGYRNLIQAARTARIRRFVYTSALLSKHTRLSPLLQCKRETEAFLAASGLDHVIFRAGVFMDVAFAMMGSAIPIRGSENATVLRPFAFANRHFARARHSIEKHHVALISGDGTTRHGFVCIDDVANFLATAAFSGPSGVHSIGGPEALTFLDIVRLYERILGTPLRTRHVPAGVFRAAVLLLRPFSPAAANLMALNYIAATENSDADCGTAAAFGERLTSAEAFLRAKAGLAEAAGA